MDNAYFIGSTVWVNICVQFDLERAFIVKRKINIVLVGNMVNVERKNNNERLLKVKVRYH